MKTFKNINFTKRNYESTNIVACTASSAPTQNFVEADDEVLTGLDHLYTENGARYYGYM